MEVDQASWPPLATLPRGSRWATAVLQGMRPSECLGLTWDRVDFDRGVIID